MDDELSREAFAELVIRELRKQGVTERGPRGSSGSTGGASLLGQSNWTAEKTYKALLFDQPRAPSSGVTALAIVLERKSLVEEQKEESSSAAEDDWLRVNHAFRDGVCALVSTSPSRETSRLASALFVDCVFASLFNEPGSNGAWLQLDAMVIASVLSGSFLRDHRPQDMKIWTNRVADIAKQFEKTGKEENYKKYLHALRECVAVEAENCASSTMDMNRFESALDAFMRCAPSNNGDDQSSRLLMDFWDSFSGISRDCKKFSLASSKICEKALVLLQTIKDCLLSSDAKSLRPAFVASALLVVDVMLSKHDQSALQAVWSAGIVRFACVAWGERAYAPHDTFLGSFLLRMAWRSDKACDFMLAVDAVRTRALSEDELLGSQLEKVLWPLVLAICSISSETKTYRAQAASVALRKLESLDGRASGPFFRYLASHPKLLERLRNWEHVDKLLQVVNRLKPVRPVSAADGEQTTEKESVDEDFAKAHATYKRVIAGLRGGSVD